MTRLGIGLWVLVFRLHWPGPGRSPASFTAWCMDRPGGPGTPSAPGSHGGEADVGGGVQLDHRLAMSTGVVMTADP